MDKAVNFVAVLGVIIVIVLGYVVFKKMEIYDKGHEKGYEIGKCYKAENDDPFAEPIYIKIIDKKKGYVKYVFSSTPQEKYSVSQPEWWLDDIYKEVDCASFEGRTEGDTIVPVKEMMKLHNRILRPLSIVEVLQK